MQTLLANGDFPERGQVPLTFNGPINHIHEVPGLSTTDKDLAFGNAKSADNIRSAHDLAGVILNHIDEVLED